MNHPNIALCDLDGTVADFEVAMTRMVNKIMGTNYPLNSHHWLDEKHKELVTLIKRDPGFWKTLPPIELGFRIFTTLKAAGFELHVLTKGPYNTTSAWSERVEWCRFYLPNTPVTITEEKSLVYGKVLVDDWPKYCEAWLEFRPRGLVIMPAYDYNEGFDLKYPNNVIRATADNLPEVCSAIQQVLNRTPGQPLVLK